MLLSFCDFCGLIYMRSIGAPHEHLSFGFLFSEIARWLSLSNSHKETSHRGHIHPTARNVRFPLSETRTYTLRIITEHCQHLFIAPSLRPLLLPTRITPFRVKIISLSHLKIYRRGLRNSQEKPSVTDFAPNSQEKGYIILRWIICLVPQSQRRAVFQSPRRMPLSRISAICFEKIALSQFLTPFRTFRIFV